MRTKIIMFSLFSFVVWPKKIIQCRVHLYNSKKLFSLYKRMAQFMTDGERNIHLVNFISFPSLPKCNRCEDFMGQSCIPQCALWKDNGGLGVGSTMTESCECLQLHLSTERFKKKEMGRCTGMTPSVCIHGSAASSTIYIYTQIYFLKKMYLDGINFTVFLRSASRTGRKGLLPA